MHIFEEETEEDLGESPEVASQGPDRGNEWAPKDVTPKSLRGRGVRILRVFTGFKVSPYSHKYAPCYVWRVQVPWNLTGWRCVGVFRKLRLARDKAEIFSDP
jgi:hypothetical protein